MLVPSHYDHVGSIEVNISLQISLSFLFPFSFLWIFGRFASLEREIEGHQTYVHSNF